jgi:hypothetical protein
MRERAIPEFNPYAAPEADISSPEGSSEIRREGDLLVIPRLCMLPPRCIKCNAPMDGTYLDRKLYWHSAGWYFLIFFNIIIYAAVAAMVRKTATVQYGLCAEHRSARRRDIAIIVALMLGSPAIAIAAAAMDVPVFLLLWLVGWLAAAVYAVLRTNVLRPQRIDDVTAWVKGASPAFLASLSRD